MKITLDIPDNTDQAALVVILREAADYLNNEEDPVELMDSTIRIPSIHGAVFLDPQPDIEPIEPPAPKKNEPTHPRLHPDGRQIRHARPGI